jgi:protein-L-isoaspartate(D-aspartate) O-methyltransferase
MRLILSTLTILLLPSGFLGGLPAQSLRDWRQLAEEMVETEIAAAGVTNKRVLHAMRETARHEFVPVDLRHHAYLDMALPIGSGQTISPPFIVAYMTQEIDPQPTDRVLEIGTGSGYQAAVLSSLVREVYSIEIVESLSRKATRTLNRLGYKNVHTRSGDGYQGWPEAAPFDKIIVTCSPERVPGPLAEQLAEAGLMIIPVGERYQQTLHLLRKERGELKTQALRATLFVPMTGQAESGREIQPDPLHPAIVNGSFEVSSDDHAPSGWHYQRQLTLVTDPNQATDGERFVRFQNREPGRGCHALQGFAVDGRRVSRLQLSLFVAGKDVRQGQSPDQIPSAWVTFYDHRREMIGQERANPIVGTFDWRHEQVVLKVPLAAREAILRIGLLGAVGTLEMDDVQILAVP